MRCSNAGPAFSASRNTAYPTAVKMPKPLMLSADPGLSVLPNELDPCMLVLDDTFAVITGTKEAVQFEFSTLRAIDDNVSDVAPTPADDSNEEDFVDVVEANAPMPALASTPSPLLLVNAPVPLPAEVTTELANAVATAVIAAMPDADSVAPTSPNVLRARAVIGLVAIG